MKDEPKWCGIWRGRRAAGICAQRKGTTLNEQQTLKKVFLIAHLT